MKEESDMKSTTIAVDLAKSVFEVAVSHRPGRVAARRRLSRARLPHFFAQQQPATVLLEACGSAHHWGRHLQTLGHDVQLLPPFDVHRYRKGNKTDRADAKALLEAFRNEEIRPVPVKTVDQQAVASLHRLRSRWLATRTSRLNTLRGILREFGLLIPVGSRKVVPAVEALVEDSHSPLPASLRHALRDACQEIRGIETRMAAVELQLKGLAKDDPVVQRLMSVPGVGILTATALIALVGDIRRFRSGRHFACFLGLTPREHSTGQTRRLGRISKRGDTYVRMLLVHGARSVLVSAKRMKDPGRLRSWALELQASRGHNVATVALANKLARAVWSVWKNERTYQAR
jgi:transposase